MQEVKFRAWEKTSNTMVYDVQDVSRKRIVGESACESFQEVIDSWEYELMQFTGLYDKNKIPIYEGDIVKASSQGVWGTFEVKWRQEGLPSWILYPAFKKGEFWKLHVTKQKDGSYKDDVEVIGNKYENKELVCN